MKTCLIVSASSYGPVSTIWVNRLRIILTGRAIAPCSVSLTWPVFQRTATICIAVIGTRLKRRYISCLTGHGRDAKVKWLRYSFTPTILLPSCSSTERVRVNVRKTWASASTAAIPKRLRRVSNVRNAIAWCGWIPNMSRVRWKWLLTIRMETQLLKRKYIQPANLIISSFLPIVTIWLPMAKICLSLMYG